MLKTLRFLPLAACLVALAPVAQADDAATAAKLVGTWEGKWTYADMGGKLVVKIESATGNVLKGSSVWFGTAVGDFKDTFTKAKVKGQKVEFPEPTMDFEATLSEDGTAMEGNWTSPIASGGLKLTRKAD
jgi:heat shock protein HslJ